MDLTESDSIARLATAVSVQGIFIYEVDLIERRTIWTTPGESFFGGAAEGATSDHWQNEHSRQIRKVVDRDGTFVGDDRNGRGGLQPGHVVKMMRR